MLSGDSLWNLVHTNGTSNQIDLLGDTNYNTDWQKEVFRTAIINDFNVAVSKNHLDFHMEIESIMDYLKETNLLEIT